VDVAEWRVRQEKRLKELVSNRDKSAKKLSSAKFVEKAPAEVVAEERRRLAEAETLAASLEASLAQL
ncbi:hypothetical protein, partial [Rosenbergiella australiborealis]|uniref:hypothetical protein n=1 Tax=Rosenbergiella australiborealis TaxID=1544696 RepID=UPI001F4D64B5